MNPEQTINQAITDLRHSADLLDNNDISKKDCVADIYRITEELATVLKELE